MRGQQQGAIAMGLSGALFEQVQYHPETGQNLTSTLADYLVATACELLFRNHSDAHTEPPNSSRN